MTTGESPADELDDGPLQQVSFAVERRHVTAVTKSEPLYFAAHGVGDHVGRGRIHHIVIGAGDQQHRSIDR